MRKGMNSLCGVVQNLMGYDVRMGDVFIFINRNRTTMKLGYNGLICATLKRSSYLVPKKGVACHSFCIPFQV
ncbi:MAG: IS66 family insertion sequence element accessory protein TnpB, partial [Patescibacteria group bacterium]|nr:IS66 family insertion sequence element accessory protein TnpB [Patescibacteria group bacterium]